MHRPRELSPSASRTENLAAECVTAKASRRQPRAFPCRSRARYFVPLPLPEVNTEAGRNRSGCSDDCQNHLAFMHQTAPRRG